MPQPPQQPDQLLPDIGVLGVGVCRYGFYYGAYLQDCGLACQLHYARCYEDCQLKLEGVRGRCQLEYCGQAGVLVGLAFGHCGEYQMQEILASLPEPVHQQKISPVIALRNLHLEPILLIVINNNLQFVPSPLAPKLRHLGKQTSLDNNLPQLHKSTLTELHLRSVDAIDTGFDDLVGNLEPQIEGIPQQTRF